jgi:hypothetical protein
MRVVPTPHIAALMRATLFLNCGASPQVGYSICRWAGKLSRLNLNPIDEDDPIDEISQIEARIEELAGIAERCRKIILVSRAAIAGGVALLVVVMLGLFGLTQVAAIGSIAVVLGGIVSLGSNISTLRQTMAAISAAEALRSDLIGRIDLRVVGDSRA